MEQAEWYDRTFPITYEDVKEVVDSGCLYITKRDRDFRPTIVLKMAKLFPLIESYPETQLLNLMAFILEFVKQELMVPTKVES